MNSQRFQNERFRISVSLRVAGRALAVKDNLERTGSSRVIPQLSSADVSGSGVQKPEAGRASLAAQDPRCPSADTNLSAAALCYYNTARTGLMNNSFFKQQGRNKGCSREGAPGSRGGSVSRGACDDQLHSSQRAFPRPSLFLRRKFQSVAFCPNILSRGDFFQLA
ncbi:hypothetical protein AAFF_G00106590 [Aldrovandia affinis]|uniref:Uncharacterized protein n=1 Tax=Aldrovandia affinis TaxID=143900 RepID=A0AAD7T3E8_9TELE|nr:hypothetical protein AAFF_G00106590 [Aldrovandia affinis]